MKIDSITTLHCILQLTISSLAEFDAVDLYDKNSPKKVMFVTQFQIKSSSNQITLFAAIVVSIII